VSHPALLYTSACFVALQQNFSPLTGKITPCCSRENLVRQQQQSEIACWLIGLGSFTKVMIVA
jgi:hypothetical protein